MSSNGLENKAQEIFSNQNSSSNDMKEFIEMILKRQNQKNKYHGYRCDRLRQKLHNKCTFW